MKFGKKTLFGLLVMMLAALLTLGVFSGCGARTAYDIWLDEGNTGTKTEFLDSLRAKSLYEMALDHGLTTAASEAEWVAELYVKDITLEDLLELYRMENPDATLSEFITLFLNPVPDAAETAAQRTIRTVVSVQARFTGLPQGESRGSGGSGVILDINQSTGETIIVTNYHVLYKNNASPTISADIQVAPYGKEFFPDPLDVTKLTLSVEAVFIGGSISKDIAILKTKPNSVFKDGPYLTASVMDSDTVTVGEPVLAAGNPENSGISVTRGILNVDSEHIPMRKLSNAAESELHRVMRVDAAINHGNSGGGLFNKEGKLIGIVNAKADASDIDNIGYAIPSNVAIGIARNVLDDEMKDNSAGKYRIGIETEITGSYAKLSGGGIVRVVEEVRVKKIEIGLPAAKAPSAERLKTSDLLLSAQLFESGGSPRANLIQITRNFMLGDYLYKARRGDVLVMTVERDGETVTCKATIDENYTKLSDL